MKNNISISSRNFFLSGSLILSLLACSVDVRAKDITADICDNSCVADALSALYASTNGAQWKRSDNWLDTNQPVETWYGITKIMNEITSEVTYSITLRNNNLVGTLPFDEWIFPNLESIDFQNNLNLIGTIAENIATLTSLKRIVFRDSGVVGPLPNGFYTLPLLEYADLKSFKMSGETLSPKWGQLTSMKVLWLQGLNVLGTIPSEMFDMTNLELLNLSNHAGMTGPLPTEIGRLQMLKEVTLDRIKLTGSVPSELFSLPALESINLSRNFRLGGSIPDTVNNLSMLKEVTLSSCALTGSLPAFSGSDSLTVLMVNDNQLTGSIPENFLDSAVLSSVTVDLMGNMLSGAVPQTLDRFDDLDINLAANMIDSIPQVLCENDDLMNGLVGEYGCDAILCPIGTFNVDGRQTSAASTCETCEIGCYYGSVECSTEPCPTHPPTVIKTDQPTTQPTLSPTLVPSTNLPTTSPTTSSPTTSSPTTSPTSNMIVPLTDKPVPSYLGTNTVSPTSVPTSEPTMNDPDPSQSEKPVPSYLGTYTLSPTLVPTTMPLNQGISETDSPSSETVMESGPQSPTDNPTDTEIIDESDEEPAVVAMDAEGIEVDDENGSGGVLFRSCISPVAFLVLFVFLM